MSIFDFLKNKKANTNTKCPFSFDAGNYGGLRYFCNNNKNPGLLGQGMRTPLTNNDYETYCNGKFKQCPLYRL